jgi:hypothetical protein
VSATEPPLLRVAVPASRMAERTYAATVVLSEQLGLRHELVPEDRDDIDLSLPSEPGRSVTMPDAFLGRVPESGWLTPESLPPVPPRSVEPDPLGAPRVEPDLPLLFASVPAATAQVGDQGVALAIDVLGAAVFMLGRYEEIAAPAADEHDRYPSSASLASRGGFVTRPLLDEYVELLRAAVEHVWPGLASPAPPASLVVSHDVDWPLCAPRGRAGLRTAAGDVAVRRDPILAARRLVALGPWARRGSRRLDPCNSFDLIMDAVEAAGLRSSFYFMAEGAHPLDGDYRLDDPWILGLIARIDSRGHEVGLHPSYATLEDPGLIATELGRLRRACDAVGVHPARWGGRHHFLRWRAPTSWRAWADAGLDYDASLGWADTAGFRSGTCREHPVFDLRAGEPIGLRERPLVVMEGALLGHGVAAGQLPERVAELRRACAVVGGPCSLLWHNSRLMERRDVAAFREVLAA